MPVKLDVLFDRLNNDAVSEDLAFKLRKIAKSMENRRLDEAYPFREGRLQLYIEPASLTCFVCGNQSSRSSPTRRSTACCPPSRR